MVFVSGLVAGLVVGLVVGLVMDLVQPVLYGFTAAVKKAPYGKFYGTEP